LDIEYDEFTGEMRSIKPHALLVYRTKEEQAALKEDGENIGDAQNTEGQSLNTIDQAKEDKEKKVADGAKPDASMQSINSSSLISSSEDGEAKARAEAEKLAKKNKGLSKEELESFIDIELMETTTTTLLSIPAIIGVAETEAYAIID
jgi:hypothetical protein